MGPHYSRLNPQVFSWKAPAKHCSTLVLFHPSCRPLFISPDTVGQTVCGIRFHRITTVADPVFLVSCRIRLLLPLLACRIFAASLAALSYYVLHGQEFSQSVLFVMFKTNANAGPANI